MYIAIYILFKTVYIFVFVAYALKYGYIDGALLKTYLIHALRID